MKYNMLSSLLALVGFAMLFTIHNMLSVAVNLAGMTKSEALLRPDVYSIENSNRIVLLIMGICSLFFAIKSLRSKNKWAVIPLVLSLLLIVGTFLPLWKYMI